MFSKEIRQAVIDSIDEYRDYVIQFLTDLVEIPSVTGDETAIQGYLYKKLESMGLSIDMWEPDPKGMCRLPGYIESDISYDGRPNIVGIYKGSGNGKSLLLNGHVDVIPPGPFDSWTYHPWSAEIKDGKLYGRGSSDMKSGITAMTMALDILMNSGFSLAGDVYLEYTVDEESTGNGTLACIERGYQADAGICCETSSLNIQPACIGRIWFTIHIKGKPAGIQKRFVGVNAISKGYKIVEAVQEFEAIRIDQAFHPLYEDTLSSLPCMVSVFTSGSHPSSFPDSCTLKGSIATLPGESIDTVKKEFCEFLDNCFTTDAWMKHHKPEIRFDGYCGEAAEIPPDHPIVTTLASGFEEATGTKPMITGRQGAADTRYLINSGNTPTVIFGPGLTEQMHSTDEYVLIEDVMTSIKTIAFTILQWCGFHYTPQKNKKD